MARRGTRKERRRKLLNQGPRSCDLQAADWPQQLARASDLLEPYASFLRGWLDQHADQLGVEDRSLVLRFLDTAGEGDPQAEQLYEEISRLPPSGLLEHTMGAYYFNELGRIHPARRHYQAATRLEPELIGAWYQLGLCWQYLGIFDKAAQAFERASTLSPAVPRDHEPIARALFNLGVIRNNVELNRAAAYLCWQKALKWMPDYPQARHALALVERHDPRLRQMGRLMEGWSR